MKALAVLALCTLLLPGCHADTLFTGTNGGSGVPPGIGPTTLGFVTQPGKTAPGATMTPAIQVALLDSSGHPVPSFTGLIRIAIGRDASLLGNAQLSGTTDIAAVAGVATFSDLRIDQLGFGYTLRATATGSPAEQSAAFDISPL